MHISLEPSAVKLYANDAYLQTVNISWIPLDMTQTYTLTVASDNTQPQSFQLYKPYFIFTAPKGALPCEAYNFSVTVNYAGATYSGAGCSVPSLLSGRMLPSLPIIDKLESSLNYSLEKLSNGVTLRTYFLVLYL